MAGLSKPKQAEVLSHWYALVPGFNTSSKDFYDSVEQELKARQVPELKSERVAFSEGGLLSDNREYLRLTRERLVFDICAAPFGTSFFFSCRFAELPKLVRIWHLVILLPVLYFAVMGAWNYAGFWKGSGLLILFAIFAWYLLRNAVALGLKAFDDALLNIPVISVIYQAWFRTDSYYRQDTRLMYHDTVDEVVKQKVEEVTGVKGIKLLRFNEHDPILSELYKPRMRGSQTKDVPEGVPAGTA
jgi:hypothetical protein